MGDAGPVGWLDLSGARGEDAEIGEEGVEEGRGGEEKAGSGEDEEPVEHFGAVGEGGLRWGQCRGVEILFY